MTKRDYRNIAFIALGSLALFLPFLNSVHLFDWDEINFAECAREMIVSGNYSTPQINFQPFWEKPPLFIWMQVISMKIFGINEFAARFPNVICGLVTLISLYCIGKQSNGERFAWAWILVYIGSFLPHFYFKTGIIDPWFNLFIFLGIYQAIISSNNPDSSQGFRSSLFAGIFIGLAVLTKGPVALLIFGVSSFAFWISKKMSRLTNTKNIFGFTGAFIVSGGSWFLIEILSGNFSVIKEFFEYQIRLMNTEDSGHGGFLFYHFVILFAGCFPASIFFIQSLRKNSSDTPYQLHIKKWMMSLFWTVLIIFTIVETKIVHYSSLCWIPLTYLAAYAILHILNGTWAWKKWMTALLLFISLLLGLAFTGVASIEFLKPLLLQPGLIHDQFAIENLKATVQWNGTEWLLGLTFLSLFHYLTGQISKGRLKMIYSIFGITSITIFLLSALIVPKAERYTQSAAVEFYKKIKGKNAYLETIGFKSYAYLFYSEKQPKMNSPQLIEFVKKEEIKNGDVTKGIAFKNFSINSATFMLYGKLNYPAYFVLKIQDAEDFKKNYPQVNELYRKNGYVFFERSEKSK